MCKAEIHKITDICSFCQHCVGITKVHVPPSVAHQPAADSMQMSLIKRPGVN